MAFPSDVQLFVNDRVALYADYPAWYTACAKGRYSFSFGCRLHGNVVPLMAGIPAFLDVFDSRTRELAEYFDLPHRAFSPDAMPDLYDLYQEADYTAFNAGYAQKYQRFCDFMAACGLEHSHQKIEIPSMPPPQMSVQNKTFVLREAKRIQASLDMMKMKKKIAFVAHEFGIYPGNGGIASCLHQLVRAILDQCPNMQVDVITISYDTKEPLLANERFHAHYLQADSNQAMGRQVLELLKVIRPDYVELAEYLGLGLESLIYRANGGEELSHTVFFTDNHTATRECYEWSSLISFKQAPYGLRLTKEREHAQMILCDKNIAPSRFLANYVSQNYGVNVSYMPHVVYLASENRCDIQARVARRMDLSYYQGKFVVSCISRFEQRKNQIGLVRAFCAFLERTQADACLVMAGNSSRIEATGENYRELVYAAIPPQYRERIQIFDFLYKDGKDMIAAISDIAVMASPYENFPVAMTEYVLQGVPVLASKYSGCKDFSDPRGEDVLFDPFVEGDLSSKLEKLYLAGGTELHRLAYRQFINIQAGNGIEAAVKGRLQAYERSAQACPDAPQGQKLYLCEDDLAKNIPQKGVFDLILSVAANMPAAQKYAGLYTKIFQLSSASMVCLVPDGCERCSLDDHLVNNGIIILPKVDIMPEDTNRTWLDLLANLCTAREDCISFIPMQCGADDRFDTGAWKTLHSRVYMMRYKINLESCYHHEA